jgi:hypothetical protein
MRLYIAGPMAGLPEHNFPAFDRAQVVLEQLGHTVISPAELTRSVWNIGRGQEMFEQRAGGAEKARQYFIRRDLQALIQCDGIVFLPNWIDSRGATLENLVANQIGLRRFTLSRNRKPRLIELGNWALDNAAREHTWAEERAANRSVTGAKRRTRDELMNLYAALDCDLHGDPFAAINKLRKNERPPEIQAFLDGKVPACDCAAIWLSTPCPVHGDRHRRKHLGTIHREEDGRIFYTSPSGQRTEMSETTVINFAQQTVHTGPAPKSDENEPITLEAHRIVEGARQKSYGHPLDNYDRVARLWTSYLEGKYGSARHPNKGLDAEDCMNMMILLKMGRLMNGYHRDSTVDIAGYAECLDMIEKERTRRNTTKEAP